MKMTVRFLQSRNGNLRYRRKVPEHLRPYFGGKHEITLSLGLTVAQQHLAPQRVAQIDKTVREQLRSAEAAYQQDQSPERLAELAESWAREKRLIGPNPVGRYGGPYETTEYDLWVESLERMAEHLAPRGVGPGPEFLPPLERMKLETAKQGRRVKVPVSLDSAASAYATHRHGGQLAKAEEVAFEQLRAWLRMRRSNCVLEEVSRAEAREFLTYLCNERGQSAETIRRRLNSIRALWNFSIDHFELDTKNPWAGLEVPDSGRKGGTLKASQERLPFNRRHLELIGAHIRRALGSNKPTQSASTADFILLLRATGCRPLEIGGLLRDDIRTIDGELCIIIRPNSFRGLKTKESERIVPVVCNEANLALKRLLHHVESKPDAPLFPASFANTNTLSARLRKWLRAAGVPASPRLVPYSFRHTLAEALRVSGTSEALTAAVLGHSQGTMTARYGAGSQSIPALSAALRTALARLGEVPDHIYRADEK